MRSSEADPAARFVLLASLSSPLNPTHDKKFLSATLFSSSLVQHFF
jgi:hypothetical protein